MQRPPVEELGALELVWTDSSAPLFSRILALRQEVFVHEQGVAVELEMDGKDARALHLAATLPSSRLVGTLRLLPERDPVKIGRVAVPSHLRRHGIGRRLVAEGLAEARRRGHREAVLSSQVAVVEFYRKLGFTVTSDVYLEAGMPHVEMRRPVT